MESVKKNFMESNCSLFNSSNTGSASITRITFNHWKAGGVRESLTLPVMEQAIAESAYNEIEGWFCFFFYIDFSILL